MASWLGLVHCRSVALHVACASAAGSTTGLSPKSLPACFLHNVEHLDSLAKTQVRVAGWPIESIANHPWRLGLGAVAWQAFCIIVLLAIIRPSD